MRCPTCGTENAPDSRFCGGCGARLTPAEQRLAPTQKISDDAKFPRHEIQAAAAARGLSSPPMPAPVPVSVPPGYVTPVSQQVVAPHKPPSKPPNGSAKSMPPAVQATPIVAPPSLSMPIPARRPWGLIIVVLVIDLGLAGVGAWMLSQGLSR